MILKPDTILDITSTQLSAMPELWKSAMDEVTGQTGKGDTDRLQRLHNSRLAGNSMAMIQQMVVAADFTAGWAPWHRNAVENFAGYKTQVLASGFDIENVLMGVLDLATALVQELNLEIRVIVEGLLRPILELITSIPVVGQILDIVLGLVLAIVDLVKAVKAHNQAIIDAAEEKRSVRSPNPAAAESQDILFAQEVLQLVQKSADWSDLFMPIWDYNRPAGEAYSVYGTPNSVVGSGWDCFRIKSGDGTMWSTGARVTPAGTGSWGTKSGKGYGFVPGSSNIHSEILIAPLSYGSTIYTTVDTGSWYPMTRTTCAQAWSMLAAGRGGPTTFAIDTEVVSGSWFRYISQLHLEYAKSRLCGGSKEALYIYDNKNPGNHKLSVSAQEAVLRRFYLTLGMIGKWHDPLPSPIQAMTSWKGEKDLRAIQAWQKKLLKTDVVAYVNANKAPPGLRNEIKQAQQDLLSSPAVCLVDLNLVHHQPYRAQVELAQNSGMNCKTATDVLYGPVKPPGPTLSGPTDLQFTLPPISSPTPPTLPPNLEDAAGSQRPRLSSSSSKTNVALAAAAVGAGYLLLKNRKS